MNYDLPAFEMNDSHHSHHDTNAILEMANDTLQRYSPAARSAASAASQRQAHAEAHASMLDSARLLKIDITEKTSSASSMVRSEADRAAAFAAAEEAMSRMRDGDGGGGGDAKAGGEVSSSGLPTAGQRADSTTADLEARLRAMEHINELQARVIEELEDRPQKRPQLNGAEKDDFYREAELVEKLQRSRALVNMERKARDKEEDQRRAYGRGIVSSAHPRDGEAVRMDQEEQIKWVQGVLQQKSAAEEHEALKQHRDDHERRFAESMPRHEQRLVADGWEARRDEYHTPAMHPHGFHTHPIHPHEFETQLHPVPLVRRVPVVQYNSATIEAAALGAAAYETEPAEVSLKPWQREALRDAGVSQQDLRSDARRMTPARSSSGGVTESGVSERLRQLEGHLLDNPHVPEELRYEASNVLSSAAGHLGALEGAVERLASRYHNETREIGRNAQVAADMSTKAVGLLGEVRGDFAHLKVDWFDSPDGGQRARQRRGDVSPSSTHCDSCDKMAGTASNIANTLSNLEKNIKSTLKSAASPPPPPPPPLPPPPPAPPPTPMHQEPIRHEASARGTSPPRAARRARGNTGKLKINHQHDDAAVGCATQ